MNKENSDKQQLCGKDADVREDPHQHTSSKASSQLTNLISIGIALSAEKDHDQLMDMIISEACRVTNSDGGTLYLLDDGSLKMKILHNHSLNIYKGGKGEIIDLPAVPLNPTYVSAYAAINGQAVCFEDVYQTDNFDFSGTRKYDQMTGYRTSSMLVIPLKDHLNEVIGVLQLINAMDKHNKKTVPFGAEDRTFVEALSSLAAIALTNMNLIKEVEDLFESFARVIVTAIDAQTPYNATHTRKVSNLACLIAEEINEINKGPLSEEYFDEERLKVLNMSGWLHDVGKIATPLEVMNKASRLGNLLPLVLQRIDYVLEKEKSSFLKKQLQTLIEKGDIEKIAPLEKEMQERLDKLQEARKLIEKADNPGTFIDDDIKKQLTEVGNLKYYDQEGYHRPLLEKKEMENLLIPKGTLTAEERKIIEEHVVITEKMLAQVPFSRKLSEVPRFACMHHENLDGTGYPQGCTGDKIPLEVRILTVADIFDAFTASDRPYRSKIPEDRAAEIIRQMVAEGKLDSNVVETLVQNRLWERMEESN